MVEIKKRDNLGETIKNAKGIASRLESGTRIYRGEEVPLTQGQIERREKKLIEQNNVLEFYGFPKIRIKQSRQDNTLEVE